MYANKTVYIGNCELANASKLTSYSGLLRWCASVFVPFWLHGSFGVTSFQYRVEFNLKCKDVFCPWTHQTQAASANMLVPWSTLSPVQQSTADEGVMFACVRSSAVVKRQVDELYVLSLLTNICEDSQLSSGHDCPHNMF